MTKGKTVILVILFEGADSHAIAATIPHEMTISKAAEIYCKQMGLPSNDLDFRYLPYSNGAWAQFTSASVVHGYQTPDNLQFRDLGALIIRKRPYLGATPAVG